MKGTKSSHFIGEDVTICGQWFQIVEKSGPHSWWVADQDGGEQEVDEEIFD
jgi:hypothetical protein